MKEPFLALPDSIYRDTYLAGMREFQAEGRRTDLDLDWVINYFDTYVVTLLEGREHPKPNRVPETIFWLIDEGEFIGRLGLRHHLNEALREFGGHIGYEIVPSKRMQGYGKLICKLGLLEARKLGLTRALITCDDTNIGSAKIIEANGGILQDKIMVTGRSVKTRRYWVTIPI